MATPLMQYGIPKNFPVVKNTTGEYQEAEFCNDFSEGAVGASQFWKRSESYSAPSEVPESHRFMHALINGAVYECFFSNGIHIQMPDFWLKKKEEAARPAFEQMSLFA